MMKCFEETGKVQDKKGNSTGTGGTMGGRCKEKENLCVCAVFYGFSL